MAISYSCIRKFLQFIFILGLIACAFSPSSEYRSSPSVSIICIGKDTQIINFNQTVVYNLALINNGSSDEFTFEVNISSLPTDWNFYICIGDSCYTQPSASVMLRSNTIYPKYDVGLNCSIANKTVKPGSSVNYSVEVTNRGDVEDTINMSISKSLESWSASLSNDTAVLASGSSTSIILTITVPENSSENDSCVVIVTGRSSGNSSVFSNVTVITTVKIAPYYEVKLFCSVNETASYRGRVLNFTVSVTNTGNREDTINLSVSCEYLELVTLDKYFVVLSSGATEKIIVTLYLPAELEVGLLSLSIRGTSTNDSSKSDTIILITEIENQLPSAIISSPKEGDKFILQI